MKKTLSFTNVLTGLVGAIVLFASISFGHADDATNAPASPTTNQFGLTIDFDTSHKNTGAQDYYGLPKEAFDRLSPDQIAALARSNITSSGFGILIPVAMFAMIFGCVAFGVIQRSRRERVRHETLRLMIEKGQPIPPELLKSPEKTKQPRNDLLYGLIFSGIGLALVIFFFTIAKGFKGPWAIGLIPLFIGIAFLIVRKVEGNGPSR